jgi:phage replication-related protein YjqB (UPF0714/DUF867 family)
MTGARLAPVGCRSFNHAGEAHYVHHWVVSEFAELLNVSGVEETCILRGPVGFMAYHGGNLELMTDVIAALAAERADASYYGVVQPAPMREHVSSVKIRPQESQQLATFVAHVDAVITIHGFGRPDMFTSLLLGGRNRELAEHVGAELRSHLPQYEIVTDLDAIPKSLRGLHPNNPVNLPPNTGVQIELPPRVRGSSPIWKDWEGPGLTPHTDALIDGLTNAAITWR